MCKKRFPPDRINSFRTQDIGLKQMISNIDNVYRIAEKIVKYIELSVS